MIDYLLAHWVILAASAGAIAALVGGFLLWRRHEQSLPDSYFLRWLTNDQKTALKRASVNFTETVLNAGEPGILISAKDFRRARKALKAHVAAIEEQRAGQVHEAVLTFALPNGKELARLKTTVEGKINWFTRWKLSRAVREVLMPSVKTNIVIHLSRGYPAAPIVDESFHVFLYSSPQASTSVRPPQRVLGLSPARRNALQPCGVGVPIIDNLTDFAVAELVDNCLYVNVDVLGSRRESPDYGLLVRVLQKVDEELIADRFLAELVNNINAEDSLAQKPGLENFRVTAEGFSGRRQTVLTSLIREILTPAVNSDVLITNMRGTNQIPLDGDTFRIFFNCSPSGQTVLDVPERLWGYRLLKRGPAFAPSALGLPIVDDSGFIVGELIDNNLYLHQEYIHYGSKLEAALMARLLLEVRRAMRSRLHTSAAAIDTQVTSHFVTECQRQVQIFKNRSKHADAAASQNTLRELLKSARREEFNLLRLQAAPGEELGREFDELLKNKNVTGVTVTNDTIVVTTRTIYCVHPKTKVKYDIGAFEIHIGISSGSVKWFNTTRKVNGGNGAMNAPHVDGKGNACFGNTKDLFPMLISKREFASVVELAIAFVESVNLDDNWGLYITNWPVAAD
ncbi:MAG TPA: hypothetical protein V6D17_15395 [Candidatus Obscuribacterales bacterium]